MKFKFATVKAGNKILFDSDEDNVNNYVDINRYWRNALYTPIVGDRVLFLYDEETKMYVLQGKVVK